MKTTTAFATILALMGAGANNFVSAGCFTSGIDWPSRADAGYHAGRACRGYDGNAGAFQGNFAPGQVKRACVNAGNNKRYEFEIQNLNRAQGFDLDDNDCANRLSNEINGCAKGGSSEIAGWKFTADPNDGIC